MTDEGGGPRLSGRRGEARRNDETILASAKAVFIANPDAPVSAVAAHAGVNISSLYRRFPSKEALLQRLCTDGLKTYLEAARAAVADEDGEPWEVFATFMERINRADVHALTVNLAGRFTPTAENQQDATEAFALNQQIVVRTQTAGVLRDDVDADDLSLVFEQLTSLQAPTPERRAELKERYLALHLDSLRAPGRTPLPGQPLSSDEQRSRWQPRPRRGPNGRR